MSCTAPCRVLDRDSEAPGAGTPQAGRARILKPSSWWPAGTLGPRNLPAAGRRVDLDAARSVSVFRSLDSRTSLIPRCQPPDVPRLGSSTGACRQQPHRLVPCTGGARHRAAARRSGHRQKGLRPSSPAPRCPNRKTRRSLGPEQYTPRPEGLCTPGQRHSAQWSSKLRQSLGSRARSETRVWWYLPIGPLSRRPADSCRTLSLRCRGQITLGEVRTPLRRFEGHRNVVLFYVRSLPLMEAANPPGGCLKLRCPEIANPLGPM